MILGVYAMSDLVAAMEIACDESGSEGENLTGGNTDVFAHASVLIDVGTAGACIDELRRRVRSPATEYKANHLLREKHRDVLEWVLGSTGPLRDNAHVHLTDKSFLVVQKLVEILAGGDVEQAAALYARGRLDLAPESWLAFLTAGNGVLRTRNPSSVTSPIDTFYARLDLLSGVDSDVRAVVDRLRTSRAAAESFRSTLVDHSGAIPTLDPLIPAVVRTARFWSDRVGPVVLVHDETNTLTRERVNEVASMVNDESRQEITTGQPRLAGLRLVDSQSDPRVQLADFLAGVARKIASDELNDRVDADLTALLRPYVDEHSTWADARSWTQLRG
jgi:hypothetical protein